MLFRSRQKELKLKANVAVTNSTNPISANDSRNKSAAVAAAVEKQAFRSQFNNSRNVSKSGSQQGSDSEDIYDSEYFDIDNDLGKIIMEECGVNKTSSNKPKRLTALDNLAKFMAWNSELD